MDISNPYKNIICMIFGILLIILLWNLLNKKEHMENLDDYLILDTKETPTKFVPPSCPPGTGVVNRIQNLCRKPTINNPFMNPAATEFGEYSLPAACNADDEDIKNDIKVNFNHELFRDVEDVFERKNSQRQFYTLPNTAVPNNQTEFANWLYKLPTSANCKEDTSACLRYEMKYDYLKYPN
ncbi:hypothetical protein Indivirus_1_38 [Indivirus ILV1]|uniref:Uncharacterized protein n=1 Tax=Indivirus ILV1 TaxID=1977633 RepID=A0A1V0SCI1_9VIRU|nr:hypothetical protein Indivirus_1_38 [Indivirus ILV1]